MQNEILRTKHLFSIFNYKLLNFRPSAFEPYSVGSKYFNIKPQVVRPRQKIDNYPKVDPYLYNQVHPRIQERSRMRSNNQPTGNNYPNNFIKNFPRSHDVRNNFGKNDEIYYPIRNNQHSQKLRNNQNMPNYQNYPIKRNENNYQNFVTKNVHKNYQGKPSNFHPNNNYMNHQIKKNYNENSYYNNQSKK